MAATPSSTYVWGAIASVTFGATLDAPEATRCALRAQTAMKRANEAGPLGDVDVSHCDLKLAS